MKNILQTAVFTAIIGLSSCTEYPSKIEAVYIPSIIYNGASCNEISRERGKLVSYVRSIAMQQKRAANRDTAGIAVFFATPLYIAWTGLLSLPFTVDQSAQLAVSRGHYNALVQAGQDAGCWTTNTPQSSYNTNWKRHSGDFPPL